MSAIRLGRPLGLTLVITGCLLLLAAVGLIVCEQVWGGPQVTHTGTAYGFRIGMSKAEVLRAFRGLGESTNLRSFAEDGQVHFLESSPSAVFEAGDHWTGYRTRFPIWFQDFHFKQDRLVTLVTYLRFYEVP